MKEDTTYRSLISSPDEEEKSLEYSLRPSTLKDYIGQKELKENLAVFIKAAKERNEPLSHILLCGPPGLGKTTLAHIISNELGVRIFVTSGPALERPGDLAGILTNLSYGDILFIDEIHRLHRSVEEYLYPAMEDFHIDIVTGKGISASTLRISLQKFTLIGATTRMGLLTAPLRNRFGFVGRLEFYTKDELKEIAMKTASLLKVELTDDGAEEIAKRSRGTPRITIRLLKMLRDFAQIKGSPITKELADESLKKLGVDELGLEKMDRELIRVIIEKFNGGPVGVKTLSTAMHEDEDTIENVIEPFLIMLGFIQRTSKGRIATPLAYSYLGYKMKKRQESFF
jgi:Holliday junction DNA helicase RuvB